MTDEKDDKGLSGFQAAVLLGELRETASRTERTVDGIATQVTHLAGAQSHLSAEVADLKVWRNSVEQNGMRPRAPSFTAETFTTIVRQANEKQSESLLPAAEAVAKAETRKQWVPIAIAVGSGLAALIAGLINSFHH